jgi:hypothetical protein
MGFFGDAWDWTKSAVGGNGGAGGVGRAIWGGIKSTVGGQASFRPSAPQLDQTMANADRRASLQARANQTYLNRALQEQIEGRGPSVAELQQRQGVAQAMQNAGRQAANARGVSRGLAQRESLYAGLNAQSQAARDATLLRAQEQLSAQQQFGSNVAQQRQQDLTNRALSLQAAQGDVNAITAQQGQQTQLAQGNAERAQKGTGAGLAFAAPIIGALSDVRAKGDVEPSPLAASKPSTNWGQALRESMSSAGQGLMGQPAAPQQSPAMSPLPPPQSPVPASMPVPQAANAADGTGALQSGMAAMGQGLMLSDERAKESAVNLAPLEPYRYRYRPEFAAALAESAAAKAPPSVSDVIRGEAYADARAPREGVMAQDLERSPEGRKAVIRGKSGLRAIDEKRALSFALGQMAGLNRRIERLEGGAQ